jgi:hypothetical protein
VANAVLDGVDGILLGQETLRGCYPTESVEVVVSICRQAEKVFDHHYHFDHLLDTAYEVNEVDDRVPGATPPEAASPASSSEDLTSLNHAGECVGEMCVVVRCLGAVTVCGGVCERCKRELRV